MQPQNLTFYNLGIAPKMLQILEGLQFVSPTPIQYKAIPVALEEKDVVGIAQTGTGKTLAFGIPMIQRLSAGPGRALVLVPTRELAVQVNDAVQRIAQPFGVSTAVFIGGVSMFHQIKALKRNPRVLIATPGRLIDLIEQRRADLREVKVLVLDEADRMFDMGFQPQVERIIRTVPRERQTMLFSATMPEHIVKLAAHHMKLPIHVEIARSGTAAERVTQEVFIVNEDRKKALLRMLLDKYRGSILLFTRTKMKARRITRLIRATGHDAVEIHSDRSMNQRKQAIEGFKAGRHRLLVATDIASRGIDVTAIELVINYDLPDDIENYVHRIGRTGRAGHEGHAISFATPEQSRDIESIQRLIRKTLPIASHPEFPTEPFSRARAAAPQTHGKRKSQGSRGHRGHHRGHHRGRHRPRKRK